NILNIINGAIRAAFNLLGAVSQSLRALYQQIVWPVQLIDQARTAITDLVNQFRGTIQSIYSVGINIAGANHAALDYSQTPNERFHKAKPVLLPCVRRAAHRR